MEFLKDVHDFAKNNGLELNIDVKKDRMIFNFISKGKSYHKMVYNADLELDEKKTIKEMLDVITSRIKKTKSKGNQ